jgi:hypothetical protein
MKADIIIPEVENIFVAAVKKVMILWKGLVTYLVNDLIFLWKVMVVSKAFGTIDGEMKKTSLLRHCTFVDTCSFSGKLKC